MRPDHAIMEGVFIMLDNLKDFFNGLFKKIAGEEAAAEDKVEETAENAAEAVEENVEAVEEKAEDIVEEVKDKAEDIVEDVKDKVENVVEEVKDKLPDLGNLSEMVSGFFDSIIGKLPIDGELGDQVNEVIGGVRSTAAAEGAGINEIFNKIVEALKAKFGLEGEIGEKIKAVIEFIKSKLPL